MRFYLKLLAMIALFIIASRSVRSPQFAEAVFLVRTAYVCSFGGPSEFEALVDDAQRHMARECGSVHLYYARKKAQRMFVERQAAAAHLGICLSDEELDCLNQECFRIAIAQADPPMGTYDESQTIQAASGR